MREAILARHGESEYSVREAVSGEPAVDVRLTEEGRAQARRLGEALADTELGLCVVSEFARTRETADVALVGRDVPRLVVAELNDPRAGEFEGRSLAEYREWRWAHGPLEEPPGGGESSAAVARRIARGFAIVAARPEPTVLVVGHSLPIAYLLGAANRRDPGAKIELLGYGEPHRLSADELARGIERLERWAADPRY